MIKLGQGNMAYFLSYRGKILVRIKLVLIGMAGTVVPDGQVGLFLLQYSNLPFLFLIIKDEFYFA